MDWRLFLTTFSTIFFAEIGDKTQLAALSLSASHRSKWAVFGGSSLALVIATAIAVLAGDALGRVIPPVWLRRVAGLLFLTLGVLLLAGRDLVAASP
jgi:putative Ca2+/H+ antiporter (TMEM165/GDT1 family)